jgi:hypothetical protein
MIKPTIGRVVWFHPEQGAEIHSGETQAALVAKVLNDRLVNLAVFDDRGRPYPAIEVELWQGEGKRPKDAYCEWMPYQIGQAKRHAEEDAAKTEAPDTVKGAMAG